jgi:histidine kinase/histidine kinase/DNA gyrase B/HSP90-like ATPase
MEAIPTVGEVVRRAMRDAPPHTKRQLGIILLAWGLTLALQFFDIRDRGGPRVWAELASVILFTGGTLLVGVMFALRGACEEIRDVVVGVEKGREVHLVDRRPSLGPILFALPTMGLLAGAALSAAATVLVIRFFLGSSAIVFLLAAANVAVLIVATRVVSSTTWFLYGSAVEQTAAAARAERAAADARLAALQAQMNPHFLFNALNTVASLVRSDPRSAESTVENLSEVLRRTLERTSAASGTLGEEIDYLHAYLSVEQQRFGDRLRVDWSIPPELTSAAVPPMTLQPLVENAIKHGIAPRRRGGQVRVAASASGDRLTLAVEDDGEGFAPRFREATGLSNVRSRLRVLYGDAAGLRMESSSAGARVVVELPLRTDERHARADR